MNSSASKLVRGFNIALRGATLLSKFLLVIFLAKLLEPRELGLFGLIAATVGYAIYLLGFEFYSFAVREMLARPQSQWISMIRDQVVFYAFTYALGLPLLALLFFENLLPWNVVWWVFVLIFLEHMAQELNRLLVAAGLPNYAGFVLFVRSGAWCWVVLALMWIYPDSRQIEVVFIGWILGAFVACAMGLNWVRKLKANSRLSSIDWHWVSRGLRVAAPLLLASVAIRGIFTLDRYWVEHISGLDALGPYVLFVGMATAVISFLDAGVIDFAYPKLVVAAGNPDKTVFRDGMKRFAWQIFLTTAVLCLLCWAISIPVLQWLGRPEYSNQRALLGWLLLALGLYGMGMIAHVGLFALHKDIHIVGSQVAGLVIFILTAFILSSTFGVVAIPWAMCVAFGFILAWKSVAFALVS